MSHLVVGIGLLVHFSGTLVLAQNITTPAPSSGGGSSGNGVCTTNGLCYVIPAIVILLLALVVVCIRLRNSNRLVNSLFPNADLPPDLQKLILKPFVRESPEFYGQSWVRRPISTVPAPILGRKKNASQNPLLHNTQLRHDNMAAAIAALHAPPSYDQWPLPRRVHFDGTWCGRYARYCFKDGGSRSEIAMGEFYLKMMFDPEGPDAEGVVLCVSISKGVDEFGVMTMNSGQLNLTTKAFYCRLDYEGSPGATTIQIGYAGVAPMPGHSDYSLQEAIESTKQQRRAPQQPQQSLPPPIPQALDPNGAVNNGSFPLNPLPSSAETPPTKSVPANADDVEVATMVGIAPSGRLRRTSFDAADAVLAPSKPFGRNEMQGDDTDEGGFGGTLRKTSSFANGNAVGRVSPVFDPQGVGLRASPVDSYGDVMPRFTSGNPSPSPTLMNYPIATAESMKPAPYCLIIRGRSITETEEGKFEYFFPLVGWLPEDE